MFNEQIHGIVNIEMINSVWLLAVGPFRQVLHFTILFEKYNEQ